MGEARSTRFTQSHKTLLSCTLRKHNLSSGLLVKLGWQQSINGKNGCELQINKMFDNSRQTNFM